MFQITNSTYRFRKKKFQSKTGDFQEVPSLGQTQSHKFYLHSFRGSQNLSVNLSTPKNIKVIPKLQKNLLFPHFPHRYIQTPSNQTFLIKYKHSQQIDLTQSKDKFYRSQKSRKIQRSSDARIHQRVNYSNIIDHKQIPKYFAVNKKGKRPYNQDRFICKNGIHKFYFKNHLKNQNQRQEEIDVYGVFDGHGGSECAEFLKQNFLNFLIRTKNLDTAPQQALKQTFNLAEQKFISMCQSKKFSPQTSGACAVSCIVTSSKIIVGNVGDCRAIMFNRQFLCEMTKDHKPTQINQRIRILKFGGKIFRQQHKLGQFVGGNAKIISTTRIAPGNLNVSRTLGDIQTKIKKYGGLPGMISPQPDIKTFEKQNYQILLLASDGLFEAFSNSEIQKFYYKIVQNEEKNNLSLTQLSKIFIARLIQQAQQKSTDNITIIVVPLINDNHLAFKESNNIK